MRLKKEKQMLVAELYVHTQAMEIYGELQFLGLYVD